VTSKIRNRNVNAACHLLKAVSSLKRKKGLLKKTMSSTRRKLSRLIAVLLMPRKSRSSVRFAGVTNQLMRTLFSTLATVMDQSDSFTIRA